MRAPALALIVLMAVGCSRMQHLTQPGQGGGDRALPGGSSSSSSAPPLSRKSVNGKENPVTLIALDGTRCAVTDQRYRETSIGE